MKKAISYLLVFGGIQLLCGGLVDFVWKWLSGSADTTVAKLMVMSVTASVVSLVVFLCTRWTEVSPSWLRTRPWAVLVWSVVAAMGAVVPSLWLQELLPELPNWVESEFDQLLTDRWGYVLIVLLAPLVEEVVFRGAILRSLLATRLSTVAAVVLSALLFALFHMNPAQMPHAFLVGLLLGWMYSRTGSILPGVAYHWANNSIAYVVYNVYPDTHLTLVDILGSQRHVLMAVGFSLLILLPALYQLNLWMRRAEPSDAHLPHL